MPVQQEAVHQDAFPHSDHKIQQPEGYPVGSSPGLFWNDSLSFPELRIDFSPRLPDSKLPHGVGLRVPQNAHKARQNPAKLELES